MDLNADDFELVLLPGKCPPKEYLSLYNEAYQCWRDTWEHAFKSEMSHDDYLFSDSFTRQDEVLVLAYQGKCVGLTFFRWVNFGEDGTVHDSYFEHWPEITVRKLCQQGKNILIISQFTIHKDFRKNFSGISLRDLLVGLCYERFIHANCDAGATAVRLQKHMDEAVYKVGATGLMRDMPYSYGQRVDLIGYYHDQIHPSTVPGIADLVSRIFPKVISLVHPIDPRTREVKRVA